MNLENNYLAPRKWLKNEKKQLEWARNYMDNCTWTGEDEAATGIRYFGNYQNTPYEGIIEALEMKLNSANGIKDLTKMKAAWSQAKYRSKLKSKDKQAYNFVLNTNIKKQLKVLARQINKPMNETLEDLISGTYDKLIADKNAQQKSKKGQPSDPSIFKHLPYYFDGRNYYWSDGSPRGPIGGEMFNSDRRPYFFNGTHFFWYNGVPRQPTMDELFRLRNVPTPISIPALLPAMNNNNQPLVVPNDYSKIVPNQPIQPQISFLAFFPSFVRVSPYPENYRSKGVWILPEKFPSHVRGWRSGYIGPKAAQPSLPVMPPINYLGPSNYIAPRIDMMGGTNPFSPLTMGRQYLSIENPIIETPIIRPPSETPQSEVITRGHLVMQQAEEQILNMKMFRAFGINGGY